MIAHMRITDNYQIINYWIGKELNSLLVDFTCVLYVAKVTSQTENCHMYPKSIDALRELLEQETKLNKMLKDEVRSMQAQVEIYERKAENQLEYVINTSNRRLSSMQELNQNISQEIKLASNHIKDVLKPHYLLLIQKKKQMLEDIQRLEANNESDFLLPKIDILHLISKYDNENNISTEDAERDLNRIIKILENQNVIYQQEIDQENYENAQQLKIKRDLEQKLDHIMRKYNKKPRRQTSIGGISGHNQHNRKSRRHSDMPNISLDFEFSP